MIFFVDFGEWRNILKLKEMGKPPFCWYSYSFRRGWCSRRVTSNNKIYDSASLPYYGALLTHSHWHRYAAMCRIITVWVWTKRCFRKKERFVMQNVFCPKRRIFLSKCDTCRGHCKCKGVGVKKRHAATWLFPSFCFWSNYCLEKFASL